MSTIDGNVVEKILWQEGFDFSLSTDQESEHTILKISGTNVDIGLIWPDEDGWAFEVGDIYLYNNGELYTSLSSETPEDLVEEILELLDGLGG